MSYDVQLQQEADDYYRGNTVARICIHCGQETTYGVETEDGKYEHEYYLTCINVLQSRVKTVEAKLKEAERLTRLAQEDAVKLAQRKAELSDLVAASWGGKYEQEVYDTLHTQIAALREKVAKLEAQLAAQWRPVTEPPTDEGEYWGYDEHDRHNSVFITHYTPEHDYEDGWAWSDWEGELIPVSKWLPLTYPPPPTRDESR